MDLQQIEKEYRQEILSNRDLYPNLYALEVSRDKYKMWQHKTTRENFKATRY